MYCLGRIVWVGLLTLLIGLRAVAHETDQFTIPDRQFVDIGNHLTTLMYGAIERGVERANAASSFTGAKATYATADEMALAVNREFPVALFLIDGLDKLSLSEQTWLRNPGRVGGFKPASGVRQHSEIPLNPLKAWGCATVKAYGVYLGTDKIGHFTDMGMHYYRAYRSALRSGASEEQAVRKAIQIGTHGPISERGILGFATAGAYSNADLVANYTGMLFYRNLTEPVMLKGQTRPPMLQRDAAGKWKIAPHVRADSDFFSWFISEHLDEALNPSYYTSGMRRGIRRAIEEHAERVLNRLADAHGQRRSRSWFDQKSVELRTYWGVDYGHLGTAQELLTVGAVCFPAAPTAKPGARDTMGWTALHHAAAAQDLQAIAKLLAAGADVNAPARSNEDRSPEWGSTPLHYAVRDGRIESVRALVARGADVNAASDRGVTALHRAVTRPALAELLLASGAKVDSRDARGRSPLHWSARDPDAQSLDLLLKAGANVDARDHEGQSPLHLAARSGNVTALAVLLQRGADPNTPDAFGIVPLHVAARHTPEAAQLLLDAGASANAADHFGRTPLHDGTRGGHEILVDLLLRKGADANATDIYGTTPLHLAARHGHDTVARLLLEYGADAHARAESRRTPADEALHAGYRPLASLLRSAPRASQLSTALQR